MSLLTLPRAGVPIVDQSGRVSIEWYRFFHDVTLRVGGVSGASTSDLSASQFEDAGIEESKATLYRTQDELRSLPADIEAMRGELAEAIKALDGIRQGAEL